MANELFADKVNEMLDAYGLNWEVKKKKLIFVDNTSSTKGTRFYGLVREDTGDCFAAVPDSYRPFQNSELAELLIRVCEKTGYEIYNGGLFKEGEIVYIQLKIGQVAGFGINEDAVLSLATALNYHNYNGSMKWGYSNVIASCGNNFNAVESTLFNRARHTQKMTNKIDKALEELDKIQHTETFVLNSFRAMAGVKATEFQIKEITKLVTGVDVFLPAEDLVRAYKEISLDRVKSFMEAVKSQMTEKGESLYGLFNAVTYYTTHMTKERKDGSRLQGKYVGTGSEIDNKAFKKIMSYIS